MNPRQFLLALRGRLWVFATLAASCAVVALLVTLVIPKQYDASASVLLDYRDEQSLSGTMPSTRERTGFMQTQMDIITSERVGARVAQALGLDASTVPALLQGLKVTSSQSSVIQLTFRANDPDLAARAANAFAQAYMDTTLDLRVAPTKQATSWFDETLKTLRSDLEKAQDRLAAFQKEKGIIVTDERVDIENARLTELHNQLLRANDSTYEAQSRSGLTTKGGVARENLPEVLGNPVIQAIKAELMRAEAAMSETATRLGPNHPQYQQQASQVANLRGRMGAEMNRVVQGVQNLTAQNQARQKQLEAAVEAQRQRVIEMRDAKNAAFILARDVDTAQKAYEAAQQRYTVNKVESGARYANVTVLNEATPPERPARPKLLVNLVLGVVLGIVLGFAAVFLLEMLDRRVRSTDDLDAGLDAPVIGHLQTWNPSRLLGGNGGTHRALPSPV